MKTFAACLAAIGLWSLTAFGQADVIVRERAKNIANQNNARQGAPPAAAPANPAAAPASPQPVARPTIQQQNIARLKADLARVRQEGKASDQMRQQFAKDLLATAQGSGKPSATTLTNLSDHLLAAVASKELAAASDDKLVSKLVTLLNSGGLPAARVQELTDQSQEVLKSAGVSSDAAARITADLQAASADIEQTRRK